MLQFCYSKAQGGDCLFGVISFFKNRIAFKIFCKSRTLMSFQTVPGVLYKVCGARVCSDWRYFRVLFSMISGSKTLFLIKSIVSYRIEFLN